MQIGIGISNLSDPVCATQKAIEKSINGIEGPPKAVIFLTTIQYKFNDGFSKSLKKIVEYFPNAEIIGGTVAGFASREGIFTKGVAIVVINGEDVDVSIGIGHNTKKSPDIAGKNCARMIKNGLKKTKFPNKFFFMILSSAIVPDLPIIRRKRIIEGFPFINQAVNIFDRVSSILQVGSGKDESVLSSVSEELGDFSGIGGASSDDLKLEENYQFFKNRFFTNSVVCLGIATKVSGDVKTSFGLKPTGKKFAITETSVSKYIVKKINGHSAVGEYLKIMGWNKKVLDDRLYRKVFYFPFVENGIIEREIQPRMFGLIYGENFVFPMKASSGNLEIYQSSGKDIIESNRNVVGVGKKSGLIVSCATRLETLGGKTYKIKEQVYDKLLDDYLIVYTAGEYSKQKGENARCLYQSDNALLFGLH
ncbi:MAG: FIST N-terminal domain-containing protein [Candidatus Diapherotrites archaeon]